MRSGLKKLLIFTLSTRLLILILPWLTNILSGNNSLNFFQFLQNNWNRWDAPHYLYIAQNWYTNAGDAGNFIVFFPLYPLIVKLTALIFNNFVFSGILAATALFLIGAYYFYQLVKIDYGERVAAYSVIALSIFPTSYFFNSPYTESLFLLIFAVTMYAARKEKWIISGIFAGLGVLTRPSGMLLLPAIMVEWFLTKKRKLKSLPIIVSPTLVALGSYLYLNKVIYGNYFEFQKILRIHWQKHLVFPFSSVLDSWRIAFSKAPANYVIMIGWAESLTITVSWILIPFAFKYLRKSWAVFYTLSVLLLSSTGFILSTPRYLLSIPPLFVLIALAMKNKFFVIICGFISLVLLSYLTLLYTSGQWAF